MPKRGETRPYHTTYTWPPREPGGIPVQGTVAYRTEDDAIRDAHTQAATVAPNGGRCTVVVTHRDQPDVVLLALDPADTGA